MAKVTQFIFKPNTVIGTADAEGDKYFLDNCYVDTGYLSALTDSQGASSVILGRTGSGKSALIQKIIDAESHCISINPESLALGYISNSDVIRFFDSLGVRLDVFYKLLWRHILTVELLQAKYKSKNQGFFQQLFGKLALDRSKRAALDYLQKWGQSFWLETQERVTEVLNNIENELKVAVNAKIPNISFDASARNTLSDSTRREIINIGNQVVNKVQIAALEDIIKLLETDIFSNHQEKYFIVIDKLDENWIDDNLRYKLIRALIDTIKVFNRIKPIKIILALRIDLLENVIRHTRDPGFQEEKYRDLYLKLRWNEDQLKELLDKRISFSIKQQYTSKEAKFDDIFNFKIPDKKTPFKYIIERSFRRPRDLIDFVNKCFQVAQGRTQVTFGTLREAEILYSKDRLKSVYEEWFSTYPYLPKLSRILQNKGKNFSIINITESDLDTFALEITTDPQQNSDELCNEGYNFLSKSEYNVSSNFVAEVIQILHTVGLIGVKLDDKSEILWNYNEQSFSRTSISEKTQIYIHPMFWAVLNTYEKADRKSA